MEESNLLCMNRLQERICTTIKVNKQISCLGKLMNVMLSFSSQNRIHHLTIEFGYLACLFGNALLRHTSEKFHTIKVYHFHILRYSITEHLELIHISGNSQSDLITFILGQISKILNQNRVYAPIKKARHQEYYILLSVLYHKSDKQRYSNFID